MVKKNTSASTVKRYVHIVKHYCTVKLFKEKNSLKYKIF